jgi:exosortase K
MNKQLSWRPAAQLMLILLCALTLKLYYSTASANELRWILAPTTLLVELVTGSGFEFESYAGYINADRSFVIAPSCAGVNFLITAFLMLSLRKLWTAHSQNQSVNVAWLFIPVAALFAYVATLLANTVRISTALRLHRVALEIGWLTRDQVHRFEGILIYFGFLLLLYIVNEKISNRTASVTDPLSPKAESSASLLRQSFFPLLIYYATTIGLPLANGAYHQGHDFWEHTVFVLLTPLLVILPLATLRFYRNQIRGGIETPQPTPPG